MPSGTPNFAAAVCCCAGGQRADCAEHPYELAIKLNGEDSAINALLQLKDGSLLLSDNFANCIYRITYDEGK